MRSASTFCLSAVALVCLLSSNPANAWSIKFPSKRARSFATTSPNPKVDCSSLGYKSGVEDECSLDSISVAMSAALPVKAELPSKWELPRHSPPADAAMRERLLWDTEMILGRVAMVAALCLLAGEVFTGLSMTDQVTSFL